MTETSGAERALASPIADRRMARLEKLIDELRPRLSAFIRRLAPRGAPIEDLTQETLARALETLPRRQKPGPLATWLFGVAANVCREQRRARERQEVPVDDDILLDIPDVRLDPARIVERQEQRQALDRALSRLSEVHREVLLLRDSAGLTYLQIAETLSIPLGTVRSRIHNATARLLELVAEELP